MLFEIIEVSVEKAKNLARKCRSQRYEGYEYSFIQGAEKANWWQGKNRKDPPVRFYEFITDEGRGAGLLAGRVFKFGNNEYFYVNELGKYKTYRMGSFTTDCFDSLILSFDLKGIMFQAANKSLEKYYLSIGAVSISGTRVSEEIDDLIGNPADFFYNRKNADRIALKSRKPVLEYLGTYCGNSGVGTNGGGSGKSPYFIYQILDLNSSLSQKGNTTKPSKFHLLVGDKVRGICALDNKEHTGLIQKFYVDANSKDMKPTYIYILDEQSVIVPLFPKTIVKIINRSRGKVSSHSERNGQIPGLF